MCPICYKPNLLFLANHLCQAHQLSSEERKSWLKSAIFSHQLTPSLSPRVQIQRLYTSHILQHGMSSCPMGMNPQLTQKLSKSQCTSQKTRKVAKIEASQCLETKPYLEFKFSHMFSMLVVGPIQCGKTYFVEQLLTRSCVIFTGFTISGNLAMCPYNLHWVIRYSLLKGYLL